MRKMRRYRPFGVLRAVLLRLGGRIPENKIVVKEKSKIHLPVLGLVLCFRNNVPMASCCIIDFVSPGVEDWLAIDVADEGHQAFPELVFGGNADVAQHRTRQLGEEALDEIEP